MFTLCALTCRSNSGVYQTVDPINRLCSNINRIKTYNRIYICFECANDSIFRYKIKQITTNLVKFN